MISLEQTLKLIDAGYTKSEIDILSMMDTGSVTASAPDPSPAPAAPQPDPVPEPKEVSQPEPQQPAVSDYDRLEGLLKQFIGIAQANNLNQSMTAAQQQRTSTDILSGVIAPPERNKR